MINDGFTNSAGSIGLGNRMWVALNPTAGDYDLVAENGDNTDLSITKDANITTVINAITARLGKAHKESSNSSNVLGLTYNVDGALATNFGIKWDGDGVSTYYLDYDNGAGTATILEALKVLDNQLKAVNDLALNNQENMQVQILTTDLAELTPMTLPNSVKVVTGDKGATRAYVNGQLLVSNIAVSGTAGNGSGDYTVFSNATVTFNFPLLAGDVGVFVVLKEGS